MFFIPLSLCNLSGDPETANEMARRRVLSSVNIYCHSNDINLILFECLFLFCQLEFIIPGECSAICIMRFNTIL